MAENLTPKKYIDSNNMKQILTAVKNEIHSDDSIITTESQFLALPEEQKLNNSYYLYDIGVHYKNGVAYSRKKPIQLTMEEYKALGEVDPDQEYIVSADEQGILLEASDIGYSNAVSNLPCTTVQGAIDKIDGKVDDINSRITDIVNVTPSTDLSTLPKGIFIIQVANQTFGEVSVLGTCRGVCFNTGIVCHAYVCTSIIDHAYIIAYGQNTWHAFKLV